MIKILNKFSSLLIIIGLLIIYGSVGASDNEAMGNTQLTIWLLIGVAVGFVGFVGFVITEALEDEKRGFSDNR